MHGREFHKVIKYLISYNLPGLHKIEEKTEKRYRKY